MRSERTVARALERRRRRRRIATLLLALLVLLAGGLLAARIVSFSQRYPNPPRKTFQVGQTAELPGDQGVSVAVLNAGFMDESEARGLFPKSYAETRKAFDHMACYRIDVEIRNNGAKAFSLSELAASVLTVGDVYGNGADTMAMREAFPDSALGPIEPDTAEKITFIYAIMSNDFDEEDWNAFLESPIFWRFNAWPVYMAVEVPHRTQFA